MATHKNIGWFTQYYYSNQSDNNTRNLLFTSIYYNVLSNPTLKTGFNYQYMSFAEKRPTVYFSPSKFNAYEVFIDFLRDQNSFEGAGIFYNLQAATGFQYIEDLDKQNTYRLQAGLGYKFSNNFWCKINDVCHNSNLPIELRSGKVPHNCYPQSHDRHYRGFPLRVFGQRHYYLAHIGLLCYFYSNICFIRRCNF